jgi:hypothetical protein
MKSRSLGGAPPSFAGNELKTIAGAPDYERLNDSIVTYREGELFKLIFLEKSARLNDRRIDPVDIQLDEIVLKRCNLWK